MGKGISQHVTNIIVSGCRVAFDGRTTEEVVKTRDYENHKPGARRQVKKDESVRVEET